MLIPSYKYIPLSKRGQPTTTFGRMLAAAKIKAQQMFIMSLVLGQPALVAAQEQMQQAADTQNDLQQQQQPQPQSERRYRLFPSTVSRKVSFGELVAQGGRSFLDFIEYFFAVILPGMVLFAIIFGIFYLLSRIIPELIDQMLARVGAPNHKRVGIRSMLSVALIVSGVYVALHAVGFDMVSLAVMFGVLAIIVQAAFYDPMQNSASGILLQYTGTIQMNKTYSVNGGPPATVFEMGHFAVKFWIVSKSKVPQILSKTNHECFTATVIEFGPEEVSKLVDALDVHKIE